MGDLRLWKKITLIVVIIGIFSGGFLTFFLFPSLTIPINAEYAIIISSNHNLSLEIQNPLSIDLLFTFRNGGTPPIIISGFIYIPYDSNYYYGDRVEFILVSMWNKI